MALALVLLGAGCAYVPDDSNSPFTIERTEDIARDWVESRSPTYAYDGTNLTLTNSTETGECSACYEYTYTFESLHAGYGDREDSIVAQVITPHTIVVSFWNGDLMTAITDGIFDELSAYRNAN